MKSIIDSYNLYKEKSSSPVDKKIFLTIAYAYMKFIMSKVFEGEKVILPIGFGSIRVTGKKQKPKIVEGRITGLAPDWKATKDLWERDSEAKEERKVLFHFNGHTQGIRYKIAWSVDRVLVRNKRLYNLYFTRTNKRNLVQLIKNGKEYIVI